MLFNIITIIIASTGMREVGDNVGNVSDMELTEHQQKTLNPI